MCAGFQRHELKGMQKDDSVIVPPHVFQPMITDIVRVFRVTMRTRSNSCVAVTMLLER